MTIAQLIATLENANRAERVFDGAIGSILGWRQKVEYVKTDPNGEPAKKVFWIVPSGDNSGVVPPFTTSIDSAIELMEAIAPNDRWGVSFVDGVGTAIIGTGPYCHAATPALALCIASLKAKLEVERQRNDQG
jgi:hypothetical protein